MDKVFNILISAIIYILTIAIALIATLLAIITFPPVFELFKYDLGSSEFYLLVASDKLKFLPSFVVTIAVFTALLTYLREKSKLHNEIKEKRSKLFLELVKEGLEGVYDMLKDQNNDRTTWVRASRDILHALNLAKEIKTPQYLEAYRLFEEKLRHKLSLALMVIDEKTGVRESLPPQFFYGVSDWKEKESLDEVAKETSSQIVSGSVSIDHNSEEPHSTPLSEKSVVVIYNFLEYPKDYDDPLKKVKMWDGDWEYSSGVFQGAKRFVSHVNSHHAFNGKLFAKDKDNSAR
jgi:hypothetical protein